MNKRFFTSESVTEGHPDKVCDQISDAILDEMLALDPQTRSAVECFATTGMVLVSGEVTTKRYVPIENLVRKVVRDIGYTDADYGFNADSVAVLVSLGEQSADIAGGVNNALEIRKGAKDKYDELGSGDQGMMFGYACSETAELMPLPISLAHACARELAILRKEGTLPYLRPDGKTQISVEYDEFKPIRVSVALVSAQHDPDVSTETITEDITAKVIKKIIPPHLLDGTDCIVNPSGRFVIGGPQGDTGLTGRKIIVDTYGGMCRHGGGAFSGKDATKVDRSAAYMTRYIAKNIVAAGIAERCEIQVAYGIGVARPLSVYVDTFGTSKTDDKTLLDLINTHFDLRPAAIIERLNLRSPIYRQTAAYGHFGRPDISLPWEQTDAAKNL
ncbi:MAG: methionine adenosyltransferase [Defluviitaleaceae bacterium]|nr:methionine adenosyltransferase [Defluviitaleaceae bacterium]